MRKTYGKGMIQEKRLRKQVGKKKGKMNIEWTDGEE